MGQNGRFTTPPEVKRRALRRHWRVGRFLVAFSSFGRIYGPETLYFYTVFAKTMRFTYTKRRFSTGARAESRPRPVNFGKNARFAYTKWHFSKTGVLPARNGHCSQNSAFRLHETAILGLAELLPVGFGSCVWAQRSTLWAQSSSLWAQSSSTRAQSYSLWAQSSSLWA